MSEVQDYMIHQFLVKNNGKATKQQILEALGKNEESKRVVREKLMMMERFGIISIKGDLVSIKSRE